MCAERICGFIFVLVCYVNLCLWPMGMSGTDSKKINPVKINPEGGPGSKRIDPTGINPEERTRGFN